ncbi:hypothetical protein ACLBX9_18830 [Methylobacterium sp. A49B]
MKTTVFLLFLLMPYLASTTISHAQWRPSGGLLDVAVTPKCSATGGKVALATQDGVYLCPSREAQINAQVADASHFYLVHAYGHLAIHNTSDKLADCWAAHTLAAAPRGPHFVRQWIKHWRAYGTTNPTFGTPEQRIANVRGCCACGV